MKKIIEWIVRWLIDTFLRNEFHLHSNPTRKVSDFISSVPEFSNPIQPGEGSGMAEYGESGGSNPGGKEGI
jgi:hypothetical protein